MSRTRRFVGLWIVLITSLVVFPGIFYLLSVWLDDLFGITGLVYMLNINVLAAVVAVGAGLFWITWAYSYLHWVGGGSPVEAFGRALYPTQTLVVAGPYAYTRNPMLLGLLLILLAIALAVGSLSGLMLIPLITFFALLYIQKYEEPELERRFGQEYIEYRNRVPALIPGLRR